MTLFPGNAKKLMPTTLYPLPQVVRRRGHFAEGQVPIVASEGLRQDPP
jgi:hypothetical protein